MDDRQGGDAAAILRGAQTIDLQEEGSPGVLLLHGFGDTPQTLALLARRLKKSGYSVLAPLLPGHGRSMAVIREVASERLDCSGEGAFIDMRAVTIRFQSSAFQWVERWQCCSPPSSMTSPHWF